MLAATGLRKEFAGVVAADGVTFSVRRGEILGLLGPNGAGKTTSIRMVLNILLPDAGTILYDGRPFAEPIRNIVGYLPEERGLYRKSRVLDTILYFAALRGMSTAGAKAAAYRWLQKFQLLTQKDRKIEELSKGNQQKVQFISAVIHDPDLVVLDEPFSGLDPVNQLLFKESLLDLRARGKAVIFSTHQMDAAERLSDTLCLIHRGRVVLEGGVADVKRQYGSNTVHLEFSGDGSFLGSLPAVRKALLDGNAAELEMASGFAPAAVLHAALGRIDIRKFEVLEPSLHSIFLGIVGGETPGTPKSPGVAP
jgi:ABC-2 type transport system ATP-binding protein